MTIIFWFCVYFLTKYRYYQYLTNMVINLCVNRFLFRIVALEVSNMSLASLCFSFDYIYQFRLRQT
jgi:hypothetical protein